MFEYFERLHPNKLAAFADGFLTASVVAIYIYMIRKVRQ